MNARLFGTVLFLSLLGINICYAQGCPAGIPPGAPGCVPPDVYNSQFGTPQPKVIRQKWADRWGAIAGDPIAGSLGFVTGYKSKRLAERAALRECVSNGGGGCKPIGSFFNQCAAFVIGANGGYSASAPNAKQAGDVAMQDCNAKNDKRCRVYRTACSMAEIETK